MRKIGKLLVAAFLFLSCSTAFAQDLTGIWRGYFITETGDQYKYEVQLAQSKKAVISGVTYSYLDTRFYGKATFNGSYTKATNAAMVREIKTVELKMAGGSVACIMKCRLVYSRSGKEEFLEGVYASLYEKSDPSFGVSRGGDCGGGKVFLRKVPTSDFYVESFLRSKKPKQLPEKTDTLKTATVKKSTPKVPVAKTAKQATTQKPEAKATITAAKPVEVKPEIKTPDATANTKPVAPKTLSLPVTIRDRRNELTKTIAVSNQDIEISLYDNGEIDGDTVSIYLDGALVLNKKGLSNKPIVYTLHLDESSPEHTLTMVAENMGRIPPNTSLMIIHDGEKRYQVGITSTEQKNAMVRFRYEKGS